MTLIWRFLEYARKRGKLSLMTPIRPGQSFPTMEMAKELFCKTLEYSDLVKVSEEEMSIITGLPLRRNTKKARSAFSIWARPLFRHDGRQGSLTITKR